MTIHILRHWFGRLQWTWNLRKINGRHCGARVYVLVFRTQLDYRVCLRTHAGHSTGYGSQSVLGANASSNPSADRQGTLQTTTPPPGHSACAAALTTAAVTHSVILVKSVLWKLWLHGTFTSYTPFFLRIWIT
jgi:hypothetical protein